MQESPPQIEETSPPDLVQFQSHNPQIMITNMQTRDDHKRRGGHDYLTGVNVQASNLDFCGRRRMREREKAAAARAAKGTRSGAEWK